MTAYPHIPADWLSMRVLPPAHNLRDAAAMEQLIGTLGQMAGPIAFELFSTATERQFRLRGEPSSVRHVAHALYAVYRQVEVTAHAEVESQVASTYVCAARLRCAKPAFLSLKTWREFEGREPLDALLGAFTGLQADEKVLAQVILRGAAPKEWATPHLKQLAALQRRGYEAEAPVPAQHLVGFVLGLALMMVCAVLVLWAYAGPADRWWLTGPALAIGGPLMVWCFAWRDTAWQSTLTEEAAHKLREQALAVDVRLFAWASNQHQAQELLERLISAYGLFNTTAGNQFVAEPISAPHPNHFTEPSLSSPLYLSVQELAGLWHLPVGEGLEATQRQTFERLIPVAESVRHPEGLPIGEARKGDQSVPVTLTPEALQRNLFVIGKTQHGKSSFLEHLAVHWMQDPQRAVLVIDPHGDLAERLIGLVPAERVPEVIYLDLADEGRVAGLNLLDVTTGGQPDSMAEDFVDVGRALWGEFWGPRMQIPLGMGLRALAHANLRRRPEEQFTIFALSELLTANLVTRKALLDEEVPASQRPDVRRYFDFEYANLSPSLLEQVISPVLSKCHAFERSAAIRRLVGQPHSTVPLAEALRQRKIILLNTNAGMLGDDLAGFLGSLVINLMRRIIMRQATVPRAERILVSVIADEFQTLTGTDFGALLGELQKYGGNFALGTQSLNHLRAGPDRTDRLGQILAGVETKVVLQVNGEDAHFLAKHELDVARLHPESLLNVPRFHAYVKTLGVDGRPLPVYSVQLAQPLAPDETIRTQVELGRAAYTLPADEADQLVHQSLVRIQTEYGAAIPRPVAAQAGAFPAQPPSPTDIVTRAMQANTIGGDGSPVKRAKAVPPGRKPPPNAEADFEAVAQALRTSTKPNETKADD